jgi:hypothetical protein
MAQTLPDIPIKDDLVDDAKKMGGNWYRWISFLLTRVLSQVQSVASIHRIALSASLGATTIYTPSQPATFRVSWAVQVTTAATVSSSIAVTITWTANGIAQTKAFTANTGNTTATNDSGSWVIRPDSGLPIKYQTTYASVGATSMAHTLDVVVEQTT